MPGVNTKNPKKRSAPSQGPSKSKKAHIVKTESTNDKGKKRSKPVTAPIQDNSDITSDEGEDEEFEGRAGEEEIADEFEEEPVEEDSRPKVPKDPNGKYGHWGSLAISFNYFCTIAARESHKAQRALLNERRAAKPHSALLSEAKKAWSLARQKNISKDERTKHINALMEIIRSHVKEIVFKHDASRIVQTVVKYGGQKERNEIALELKGRYQDLAQNKYSKVRSLPLPKVYILTLQDYCHSVFSIKTYPPMPIPPDVHPQRISGINPSASPSQGSFQRPRRLFRTLCKRLRTFSSLT